MISEDSYYIKVGDTTPDLKKEIIQDIQTKFGTKKSTILDNLNFEHLNGITIYTALNKKFEFLEEFDNLDDTRIVSTGDFDKTFEKVLDLENTYENSKEFKNIDVLKVPYMNLNFAINYEELCQKELKESVKYLSAVVQNIQFSVNPKGGVLFSESAVMKDFLSQPSSKARILNFCKPCYIFIKEKDKEKPYFAMKINSNFVEIVN